jgi:hypothetical protein
MTPARNAARIAGALYLLTVITSIPALALKAPLLTDPSLLASAGGQARLHAAAGLELVLAMACAGTAVVLFPIVRRVEESAALGFVCSRTIEAAIIVIGVIAMLSLGTLAGAGSTPGGEPLAALVAIHDWAFLIGPGLLPAVNALLLGSLLYRSGLVPKIIPSVGLIGAPLLLVSAFGSLIGLVDQVSTVALVAALPVAAWEISLGCWLLIKGFRPAALGLLLAADHRSSSSTRTVVA